MFFVQVFEVLHYVGSCLLKMVRTKMRSGKKPPDSSGDTGDPFLPCSNNNNNNNSASEGARIQYVQVQMYFNLV